MTASALETISKAANIITDVNAAIVGIAAEKLSRSSDKKVLVHDGLGLWLCA